MARVRNEGEQGDLVSVVPGIVPYETVHQRLSTGTSHLLIGNGFSIGCDPIFHYRSLYGAAVELGLSPRAQAVFQRLGTNNFEGVMRLLDDTHWVAREYGLIDADRSAMLDDVDVVKRTLVEAIARSHLDHAGLIAPARMKAATTFIGRFTNVFCTNYDLLPYWVNMHSSDPPPFGDGFRADADEPELTHLVFSERLGSDRGLFYIHGGLHLFGSSGEVRKHCWTRTGVRLTELVRQGLAEAKYPLFVAEGDADKKLSQIQSSGYLSYCLGKLGRVQNRLVVYGHSLGRSDQHIVDSVADNTDLTEIWVGLFGDEAEPTNVGTRRAVDQLADRRRKRIENRRRAKPLVIRFFDSASAKAWG